ncbi:MAG: lysoplasmalogenase [Saprospiraceae bacterium]|nr:lysoplasmalogenase [Saprospiraceae bacterium]MDW8228918.1 lysoplasmalogenase [Saprospiraceae bacterium]
MRTIAIWVFAALSFIHVVAEMGKVAALSAWTKPWLMPLLALWFWSVTSAKGRFLRSSLLAALVFSTLGDMLLLFSHGVHGELFFLLGLLAFLFAQVSYLGGFLAAVGKSKGFLHQSPLSGAALVVFLVGFLYWLWPSIPEGLQLPVAVYGAALVGMALSVLHARFRLGEVAFSQAMSGAMLFLLSDCLLAAARFGHPFAFSSAAIMATYLLGQWLLVRGAAVYLGGKSRKVAESSR